MGKLSGKTAIVTGATSGMGLDTAKLFLQEGAKVVLTGRSQEKLNAIEDQLTGDYLLLPAEASNISDSKNLIAKTTEKFGKIDILFLNAGVFRLEQTGNLTEEIFDEVINVNLKGPIFTVNEAVSQLNDGGSIIFNTSVTNVKGFAGMAAYASSKAALRSYTKTLTSELGSRNIRVNAISPGPIDTPIYGKHNVPQEHINEMASSFPSMIPLGRFGKGSEVATVALFLASDDASFMNGTEIPVDGGFAQM